MKVNKILCLDEDVVEYLKKKGNMSATANSIISKYMKENETLAEKELRYQKLVIMEDAAKRIEELKKEKSNNDNE